MDMHALERARARLRDDGGALPRVVAEVKRLAAQARADCAGDVPISGPPAWAVLDGQLRADLAKISAHTDCAEQLLAAERAAAEWIGRAAAARATLETRAAREREAAQARRLEPLREASRSGWAEVTGQPVLSALKAFANAGAAVSQRIRARPFGDEATLIGALDELAGELRILSSAIAAVRRESKTRSEAAEAASVVEHVKQLVAA